MALNPNTDVPNRPTRPTNSFHERYASDAEFKRQVDEGRRRVVNERNSKQLQGALDSIANKGGSPKLY